MLKTSFLTTVLVAALAAPAFAQADTPNGSGAGLQRGIETLNSSGQVGMVTILRGSGNPMLDVNMKGTNGHPESVTLVRGKECTSLEGGPIMKVGALNGGVLHAASPISGDRLLSGNYNVVVHNNTPTSQPVACGHIYVR